MESQRLIPGDSTLVENIVNYLKAKGIFDEFRHECLADVDTKSSCQNLSQRVDGYASKFLANETWNPDLNKNELRNKLRRHIDESGMLAVGADHVVEQVINPKIHQLFLPKIIEVVHQYMKEQNEMLNKKPETSPVDNILSENASDASDSNKAKTSISDPIADILSFSYSKTKSSPVCTTHTKTDNTLQKHTDLLKVEKKKEEKSTVLEKNAFESPCESHSNPDVTEVKPQNDKEKEKNKKDEPEIALETPKKAVKEEIKLDKKKVEEAKPQSSELNTPVEEIKVSTTLPLKPNTSSKKDVDKNKQKSKSVSMHKSSSASSDVKKSKKESSEKHAKSKLPKPSKESPSPTKSVSSVKSVSKDEKSGEISKSKSSDSSSSRTSESSQKKSSKSNSSKIDLGSSKHKSHSEKSEKYKISKLSDKNDQNLHHESANSEKGMKNILYSSSYDSSQGSDQEKSSSSSSKKERQKYFSKHTKKESSEKHSDKSTKVLSSKRRSKDADESPSKKHRSEKNAAHEKFKETITVAEAAKISSRSNSFGSTSSVSSSSNTSKDNLVLNSDEASESSRKDKKKKQAKEKEPCHISKTLPPPPPPPPPSSSLSCELTSSAEVSSIEDTQSSSNSDSSSEELSEQSSSDSEVESKESILNTLNENVLNSSTDDINDFYDIFLYSSSSSEFEGYGNSPDKKRTECVLEKINESDISVSSVHTSDLSSYDDELSDDDFFFGDESHPGRKKRLTLREAQELIQKRKTFLQSFDENKKTPGINKSEDAITFNKRAMERSSSLLSSDDESFPSEPKRSLRRERKLNPRYASSEYTSIFNSRKETFITKQSSPYAKNQTPNSSPMNEMKYKKESIVEKDKSFKKNSVETRIVKIRHNVEKSQKTKRKVYTSENFGEDKELSDSSVISSSDEMDSIMNKEKSFSENDESNNVSGSDQLKLQLKFKHQNISNYSINSYPVKRKLKDAESNAAKRPCSRGSVDSSSSECVPNENKPFNSEKNNLLEEKAIRDGDFKVSDLADAIKKDLFCKQRTNNNGDILGQKDIFPKHSRGKALSTPEKKTSETENSKELSAL